MAPINYQTISIAEITAWIEISIDTFAFILFQDF